MTADLPKEPERLAAILMRHVTERLGLKAACPARACRRNGHCSAPDEFGPPCREAADAEDRQRFDALFGMVEAIRSLTLWPEPSRDEQLRALELAAIKILLDALPSMPDFAVKFADWRKRYNTWPTRPGDHAFWMKLARAEIARCREVDRCRGERGGSPSP